MGGEHEPLEDLLSFSDVTIGIELKTGINSFRIYFPSLEKEQWPYSIIKPAN